MAQLSDKELTDARQWMDSTANDAVRHASTLRRSDRPNKAVFSDRDR
jgi:hypothetical protein